VLVMIDRRHLRAGERQWYESDDQSAKRHSIDAFTKNPANSSAKPVHRLDSYYSW
jgi:hypothetical protein